MRDYAEALHILLWRVDRGSPSIARRPAGLAKPTLRGDEQSSLVPLPAQRTVVTGLRVGCLPVCMHQQPNNTLVAHSVRESDGQRNQPRDVMPDLINTPVYVEAPVGTGHAKTANTRKAPAELSTSQAASPPPCREARYATCSRCSLLTTLPTCTYRGGAKIWSRLTRHDHPPLALSPGAQIDLPNTRHSGINDYRKDAKVSQVCPGMP